VRDLVKKNKDPASSISNVLFSVSRSKYGSRTGASSGANKVWNSSRPNWPSWAWPLLRKVPDLKAMEMKAMRMRSSPNQM